MSDGVIGRRESGAQVAWFEGKNIDFVCSCMSSESELESWSVFLRNGLEDVMIVYGDPAYGKSKPFMKRNWLVCGLLSHTNTYYGLGTRLETICRLYEPYSVSC